MASGEARTPRRGMRQRTPAPSLVSMAHTTYTPSVWRGDKASSASAPNAERPSPVMALLADLVAFGPLLLMLFL
jgi:hypothetical protein